MAQIELMRAAAETVEDDEHRPGILRANVLEFLFGEKSCPWGKVWVVFIIWRCDEVNGKGASIYRVLVLEEFTLVVDGHRLAFKNRPHGLEVAVEEKRI